MQTRTIKILAGVAAAAILTVGTYQASPAARRATRSLTERPAGGVAAPPVERMDVASRSEMRPQLAEAKLTASVASDATAFWATRKLVRSGELRILVKDVRRAIAVADSVGGLHGALLADSRANGDARTTQQARLEFRVPADRFAETVAALRDIGDVRAESITTQDVTREYTDLATRLRVKDETVTRLRALLATHTAKLADVLQVEQELARAVTELEQLKGERQYYDQQIAMSALSIDLFEQVVVPPRARFTDPVVAAARRALEVLGASLAAVVYGVVFVVPWILVAALAWWGFALIRPRPAAADQ